MGTSQHKEKRTLAASSTSSSAVASRDEPDLSRDPSFDIGTLLDRLYSDIGCIALMSGKELEVLSEFEPEDLASTSGHRYDLDFLKQIKDAANRHLVEKQEIRNALGLLNLYHKSYEKKSKNSSNQNQTDETDANNSAASPSKRKRSSQK